MANSDTKQPDAEYLRREYNDNYSGTVDRWSVHGMQRAQRITHAVLKRLDRAGFGLYPGMRSLDVGCAKGHISEALRLAGFESWGLDYSDIAVQQATENFPHCRFVHMNGFKPSFDRRFDLILVRGFSGANTHDMDFVADFSNRYIELLKHGGFYVIGFNSDFSGREKPGETANWSMEEIDCLSEKLHAETVDFFLYPPKNPLTALKHFVERLRGATSKDYFYIVYKKPGVSAP